MRKYILALILILVVLMSASFVSAAVNPNVVIVNPVSGAVVSSDNLLISVKVTAPSTIKVSVTQEFKVVGGEKTTVSLEEYQKTDKSETASSEVGTTDSFTSVNNLSFYIKKVENLTPGVYTITVNTVDPDGKVLYTNSSPVEMKAKEDTPADSVSSESGQSGPAQFLKNLLKIIFN